MNFKRFNGSTWETVQHKIYGSDTDSLTAFPAVIQASGEPLTDYLIEGNTYQASTPTPSDPVDVVGCGDIWNHWNGTLVRYHLGKVQNNNAVGTLENGAMFQIKAVPNVDYTVEQDSSPATSLLRIFRSNNPLAEKSYVTFDSVVEWNGTGTPKATINSGRSKYIWIQFGGTWYDSYGASARIILAGDYVIPITSGGDTKNIYLGNVQTVRRIKKLVFDGTENWYSNHLPNNLFNLDIDDYVKNTNATICLCTHYKAQQNITLWSNVQDKSVCFYDTTNSLFYLRDSNFLTVADLKSYLAAQYAAGTPVCVWYVLAAPETGIVSEPLMKIGDYADTISMAQAGETIPTIAGSNTLSVGTTVQPSGMSATFKGWHPVDAPKTYDGNDWS